MNPENIFGIRSKFTIHPNINLASSAVVTPLLSVASPVQIILTVLGPGGELVQLIISVQIVRGVQRPAVCCVGVRPGTSAVTNYYNYSTIGTILIVTV